MTDRYHITVLKSEITEFMAPNQDKVYIDCTFGGGGHSIELLKQGAKVIGIDQDQEALINAEPIQQTYPRLQLIKANFTSLQEVCRNRGIDRVDGIIFDLGVSSKQFDTPERGFSFRFNSPLDMRMDHDLTVTASDLIAALGKKELEQLFIKYGGETRARAIAEMIVEKRAQTPITTTDQLAHLVERVYKSRTGKIHPATKVFQALRIAVNDELVSLELVLPQAYQLLKVGGRLAIISFHEGEDQIVKHYLKHQASVGLFALLASKPITPSINEIKANPRARSAKLRLAEKIK